MQAKHNLLAGAYPLNSATRHVPSTDGAPLRTCCLPTEDVVNEPWLVMRGSVAAAEGAEDVIFWKVAGDFVGLKEALAIIA